MKKILLTGGSGLVGQVLTQKLLEKGYEVLWLSRTKKERKGVTVYTWDWQDGFIEDKAFEGVTDIIHLAGANIATKNWSESYKKLIADSRVQTTKLLLEKVKQLNVNLESFVASSAIGYYGTFTSEATLTEQSPHGTDFLAKVCVDWEKASFDFEKELGIRTVCVRTGVVFAKSGGAFPKIKRPIQLGVGSAIGSGKQYMPWIHIDDLATIYMKAIEDKTMRGSYNATAPEKINNLELTKQLAAALGRKIFLPNVPTFILKLFLGSRADLLTKGTFIIPKRLQKETDFHFLYPDFRKALVELVGS